jgi:uncharacterized protein (DUF362 family)
VRCIRRYREGKGQHLRALRFQRDQRALTGVIKNLFGLLPRKRKIFYHPEDNSTDFNNVIVDLARFLTPNLCIVDAIARALIALNT